ncbi:MAG: DUF3365 domain-containing protein [Bacteroidales bacterium]|nr:DUF3365 domain-containing protein [Bacteroidales bacterium]
MNKEIRYIKNFFYAFLIGLFLIMSLSLAWSIQNKHTTAEKYAEAEAIGNFNKDLIYRKWAAMHGGVYVQISEHTQPNTYLANDKERDVTTLQGKKLTLINPAYMMRQVHELSAELYGAKGHITSLNPIRPENKADAWETAALHAFEKGDSIYIQKAEINKTPYLRIMKPIVTDKNCLKCHNYHGYKEGEIRGGLSISIPLDKFYNIAIKESIHSALNHGIIFLIVIIISTLGYKKLINEMKKRNEFQFVLIDSEKKLKQQNKEYLTLNEEYKLQNELLHSANKKAEESIKLKSVFLRNISHEFRTPMNGIIGFSELLISPQKNENQKKQYAEMIKESCNKLLDVVTDIVEISQIQSNTIELKLLKFSIKEALQETIKKINFSADKKKLTFNVSFISHEDFIYSDKQKLIRIIKHLLENALKYTEEGNISFSYLLSSDSEYTFTITDTGIGISEELISKIFDPFVQGTEEMINNLGGNGIGLTIAKNYIEILGGKIAINSTINTGTTISFILPKGI